MKSLLNITTTFSLVYYQLLFPDLMTHLCHFFSFIGIILGPYQNVLITGQKSGLQFFKCKIHAFRCSLMIGGERQQWHSSDQIAKSGMLGWVFFPTTSATQTRRGFQFRLWVNVSSGAALDGERKERYFITSTFQMQCFPGFFILLGRITVRSAFLLIYKTNVFALLIQVYMTALVLREQIKTWILLLWKGCF